jgi:hypothetical protein
MTIQKVSPYMVDGMGMVSAREKRYALTGNGTTDDATKFSDMLTAIGSTPTEITFASGTYKLSSDITVPENVVLNMLPGAMFSVDSAKTLTVNGTIKAGFYQVFSGAGTIAGTLKNDFVPDIWFGNTNKTIVIKDYRRQNYNSGIKSEDHFGLSLNEIQPAFADIVQSYGFKRGRMKIYWHRVEEVEGVYDWTDTDTELQQMLTRGISPHITLSGASAVYEASSKSIVTPEGRTAYETFITAAVESDLPADLLTERFYVTPGKVSREAGGA